MAHIAEHLRFAALAAALFVLSYSGVAWTKAGAPLPALSGWFQQETDVAAPPPPLSEITVATLPAPRSPIAVEPAPAPAIDPADRHALHDKLRLDALRASSAYTASPCERMVKANLIAAVSAYAQAWHDVMGCGPGGCDQDKLNAAAVAFSTPLDMKVRDAIGAAFDKRGISIDDFSPPLRINVAMLARGPGDPAPICGTAHAEGTR